MQCTHPLLKLYDDPLLRLENSLHIQVLFPEMQVIKLYVTFTSKKNLTYVKSMRITGGSSHTTCLPLLMPNKFMCDEIMHHLSTHPSA